MLEGGAVVVIYRYLHNTRRTRSVRHVSDEFDEKPINNNVIGFKLNDGHLFAGQIPRRVLNSGRWEMLQTNVFCKLNTKDNT